MVRGKPHDFQDALIGRERELEAVSALLGVARVVTVWGPGGVGKTTLARAFARLRPGRGFFVELAEARSEVDVARALSRAVGLAPGVTPDATSLGTALEALGGALIVFDDVERSIEPAASWVTELLSVTTDVRFLVTSRERLRVPGERVLELAPLALEARGDGGVAPAVQLLIARARAARPDFVAEPRVLSAIAERLEGLPLALELAAARLSLLSAESVLSRLGTGIPNLAGAPRGAPARHASLEAVLEDTWLTLGDAERSALAHLSVFAGGCEPEAAEAMLPRVGPRDVLEALERLRDKSLVRVTTSTSGATRLVLLDLVRAFASTKLSRDAAAAAVARHASYYAGRGTAAATDETLSWIEDEQENLLAVVRGEDLRWAAEAALALSCFYEARGPAASGAGLTRGVLERGGATLAPAVRFTLAEAEARALVEMGAIDRAANALVALPEILDDPSRTANVMTLRAHIALARGERAAARKLAERSLALAEAHGLTRARGHALTQLALVHYDEREKAAGLECCTLSAQAFRAAGDRRALARTLARVGFFVYDTADYPGARAIFVEARGIARELRSPSLEGVLEGYLGNVARGENDAARAREHYDRGIGLLRSSGERRFAVTFEMDTAITDLLERREHAAIARLSRASVEARDIGDRHVLALICAYRAIADDVVGDTTGARRALNDARLIATPLEATLLSPIDAFTTMTEAISAGRTGEIEALATAVREQLAENAVQVRDWEHTRLVARALERELDRAAPPARALVVDATASHVRLPDARADLDLTKRPTLARVLSELVRRKLERAKPAGITDLAEAGWPGERMTPVAAANRVRVAISTLRSLGFDELLTRTDEGYAIASAVVIVVR